MPLPFSRARGPLSQPLLFQRLRWHLLRNGINAALENSSLRLITVLACSLMIWVGVFIISAGGFAFLNQQRLPLTGGIIGVLFDFLFLALFTLLIFSTGLILYSSLFTSPEARFLLITPARADQVFAYKYQGAVAFSSWAFVLLGSPILIAYGLLTGVGPSFYVLLPLFFLGFVLLPGSLGGILCILLVNLAPRRPRQLLLLLAILLVAGGGLWGYSMARAAWQGTANAEGMQRLVAQFAFAQSAFVPSHWMARGIVAAARGGKDFGSAVYYLALLWSNGLLLYLLTAWTAARYYRRGFNCVATGGMFRRQYGGLWMDRGLSRLLSFLDPQTQLLIVKDFRTFRRDPAQWAQVLIFTGLLSLYFANVRRLYFEEISWIYQNGISLLNLAATALLLCAYTGRFIYPMLSLEGRKFWILGLLPLRRERLLWGKFAFSATGALIIAEFLMVLSDLMLGMPGLVVGLHALTVAVLAVGLSGLSVGLGACMPNFQESDPSKIAVGFGGTLNLVAGLVFLVTVVGMMAMQWHVLAAGTEGPQSLGSVLDFWVGLGVVAGLALGASAVVLPLWIGAQALQEMEF